ncbi:MAG: sulfatase-like hydrolase/transferase [Planctomycetes bacterium]|nr:sulfatase-like hydrolase/transferase [Planctomycetota bacterium]
MSVAPRAIVISFDHWHLGYLGSYGNDWIETPHLDRLAAQGITFDRHFSDNIDPAAANHAWWTGRVQFPLDHDEQRACPSWCDVLHAAGVQTRLFIESDGKDDISIAPPFGHVQSVAGRDGFEVPEQETPFACTVQEVSRWLTGSPTGSGPAVLWVKSRGIPTPWIPPEVFSDLYLEEFGLAAQGDERTVDSTQPEDDETADAADDENETEDHEDSHERETVESAAEESEDASEAQRSTVDESLDWRYAGAMYAAYATLVDRWLGKLLQAIDASPEWRGALLIVTAGAGEALGEHGRLDEAQAPLRAESVHAPLWVRLPERDQAGTRRSALVQTTDIGPTLLDWLAVPCETPPLAENDLDLAGKSLLPLVRNTVDEIRDVLWMGSGRTEWGLRTDEFFYAEPGDQGTETDLSAAVLFEKPHDRWDQFNVLSQFGQVSDDFHDCLQPFRDR